MTKAQILDLIVRLDEIVAQLQEAADAITE